MKPIIMSKTGYKRILMPIMANLISVLVPLKFYFNYSSKLSETHASTNANS